MKTSYSQFMLMVEFMERNGDLSKPTGGSRGRYWCLGKWKELSKQLNSDGTGDMRTDDKWRKVWSDLKNNTKKKKFKLQLSAKRTGGPALKTNLTDLEQRVMNILAVQAAPILDAAEVGFEQIIIPDGSPIPTLELKDEHQSEPEVLPINEVEIEETVTDNEEWNSPGTSSDPPPKLRKWSTMKKSNRISEVHKKPDSALKAFIESDKLARESEREKLQMLVDMEKERIRQRDIELQQQNLQLQLQARWLDFMNEALKVMTRFMEEKTRDE